MREFWLEKFLILDSLIKIYVASIAIAERRLA
jgi:hypothetical protein